MYVVFLETDGSAKDAQKLSMLYGNLNSYYTFDAGDAFGVSTAAIGDLDSDGVTELVVGVSGDDHGSTDAGAACVLFLETDGRIKNAQKLSMLYGNLGTFYTIEAVDALGFRLAGPGDVDGDNVEDLAVGAFLDDDGSTDAGAVYVLFLNTSGIIKDAQKLSMLYGNYNAFYSLDAGDKLGYGLDALGDVDGDGATDMAVSAHNDDDGGSNAGSVYVLFLETDGIVKNAQKVSMLYGGFSSFYVLEAGDVLGSSINSLGDADGDTIPDVAVGAYHDDDGGSGAGAVYMLFLKSYGNVKTAQKLSMLYGNLNTFYTLGATDLFAFPIATLGDLDGDGVMDLAIGALGDDDGGSAAGAVYIINLKKTYCDSPSPTTPPVPTPTNIPSPKPKMIPSFIPSALPLPVPSSQPSLYPSLSPTQHPTILPVSAPTVNPTSIPTVLPLPRPSAQPSLPPSSSPSLHPTSKPVSIPTSNPTLNPSESPLPFPSKAPSLSPPSSPTLTLTTLPVPIPTASPTPLLTAPPTVSYSMETGDGTSGTCYHHTSTVTRLAFNGQSTAQVLLTELIVGDRILALDKQSAPIFAKVEALPHGPSVESFIHIRMKGKARQALKATLHHTFDTCVSKRNPFMHAVESYGTAVVKAKDIRAGDCLHTADGKRLVRSATHTAMKTGDTTYSIKLAGNIGIVAIGGVFTHAMGHFTEMRSMKKMQTKTYNEGHHQHL